MTYAEELAQYVSARLPSLEIGVNFFIDHMPPESEDCVILYTDSGLPQSMYLDTRYQTISVWARNKRGDTAVNLLEQVLSVLHRLDNKMLGQYYLYFSSASSGIIGLDTDERRRRIYKVTLNTIYRDTNVIS